MRIEINKFSGERPKISPPLLDPSQAQIASNANTIRGDLRAWKAPKRVSTLSLTTVQTIFQYVENSNTHWVEYSTIVDHIKSPMAGDQYERVYFTGGTTFEPRFFANNIATGDFDFTSDYLKLGIPAPTAAPSVVTTGGSVYRGYIYCFLNSYGDQGAPSAVGSDSDYGTGYALIGGIETAPADRAISKIHLYRTNSGTAGSAEFQFVCAATWFLETASYSVGDYVVYLTNLYKCTTAHSAGAWNAGNFTQGENVADDDLAEVIPTYSVSGSTIVTYDPPPDNLDGLIVLSNGVAAGFVGNKLYLSEPYQVHAWPAVYSIGFEYQIIGLGFFGTSIAVLTEGFPYIVFGSHPSSMSKQILASLFPCISRRSIAQAENSVFYSSNECLVQVGQNGATNVTAGIIDKDNWDTYLPTLIHGEYYSGKYFGFNTTGGIVIDFINGELSTLRVISQAEFVSLGESKLYIVSDDTEAYDENNPPENIPQCVKEWEGSDINYLYHTWVSKEFILDSYTNFAYVQILLDQAFYKQVDDLIDYEALNAALFQENLEGAMGMNPISTRRMCGDTLFGIGDIDISSAITFKIYADNVLKFTKTVNQLNNIFPLPKGFAGKRCYFEVSGYIPIVPPIRIAPTKEELF
ncbi:MAG: hypothetical protein GY861_28345 [bacterium]|nr:hypothetical protein [bacterium]